MNDREPPRNRRAYAEFQHLQTRWNDNDQFGHIYNATYYELFDEAMNMSLIKRGFLDGSSGGPIQVVVENGCTYFTELSYPDQLEIGVRIEKMGTSSFRLSMGMFRAGQDTESARSHFTMVTVDSATRRPMETPKEQRDALATLIVPPA